MPKEMPNRVRFLREMLKRSRDAGFWRTGSFGGGFLGQPGYTGMKENFQISVVGWPYDFINI